MKDRNIEIDTLRGIACILLVAYHVIGEDMNDGLRVSTGLYREINDILIYIRMPLFTFLSGMVYAYKPFSSGVSDAFIFIKKKMRRLLIPMLTVGTVFAIIQEFTPGTNYQITDWKMLHIMPVAHFWYLESLFIIFVLIIFFELIKTFKSKILFALVLIISSILYILDIGFIYFSVSGAFYLLPYFLLGMGFQRYNITVFFKKPISIFLASSIILMLVLLYIKVLPLYNRMTVIGLLFGFMSCTAWLSLKLRSVTISKIGNYSYTIYLYHIFFTASSRILLHQFGVSNIDFIFLNGLILGVIGPICIEHLFNGTNITRLLLLGKSFTKASDLWLTKYFTRKSISTPST